MTTRKWFVLVGDEEMGPLGPNGLKKLASRGELTTESRVRGFDDERTMRAGDLQFVFPRVPASAVPARPFTNQRTLGWTVAGILAIWTLVGALGVATALAQHDVAKRLAAGEPLSMADAGMPFLGLGGVVAAFLFLATGVLFIYWLWNARSNLPALIRARMQYAPAWTIAAWLLPVLNLVRPYQIVHEIDQLSAEAKADGDASVHANPLLLAPWWLGTLGLVGVALAYWLAPVETATQLVSASSMHLVAAVLLIVAAGFAATIVIRVTENQERAHEEHTDPVSLHHAIRRRHNNTAHA